MTKDEIIVALKGVIAEIDALGEFNFSNALKLERIDQKYIQLLFKDAEIDGQDRAQAITFATEERTRDIKFAQDSSTKKKDIAFAERYYYRASSGLKRDIDSAIFSVERSQGKTDSE